ncbi:bifunctional diguanylate cyclase/phosphodiesterase [Salinisphaera sp. Q1T1-3]|uniref:putative bifunctional diguanylate cyclase/phosphodiesterase n=1 Tax=Salinisphaera sp. Q1T1-3 TaxID=2321229 RepID=UPI000E74384E|nr:GGDEF and EAL domain-containing protein [Salinisphaera sp. Q1T1-3]RJS93233.1 EAL domain-containing protein [Salinisphaera sp. Q1T1-3]
MTNITNPPDEIARDVVRGLQVRFLERNFLTTIPTTLLGMVITCLLFWAECGSVLLWWVAISAPIALQRFYFAYRAAFAQAVPCNANAVWRHPILDVLLWLSVFLPPVAIAFTYGGAVSTYMVIVASSVMWAGVFAYIATFWLAAVFIVTNIVCWLLVPTVVGWSVIDYRPITLLVFMALAALLIARRLSLWLEKSLQRKIQLEQQTDELSQRADTIALLLHEYQDESSDWLWKVDADNRLLDVSERFARAFDRSVEQLEGVPIARVLTAADVGGNGEACRLLATRLGDRQSFRDLIVPGMAGDERRWWSISGRPVHDRNDGAGVFRGVMADVTAEQLAREAVYNLAHHDALTGLPNRLTFFNRLASMLERKNAPQVAVITLDLDGFKLANDKYGHPVGDAILKGVADRLREVASDIGLVARIGGDEFVIKTLLADRAALGTLCDDLINALSCPYEIKDLLIRIGVSAGVAISPGDGTKADTLLKNSDAALYRSKQAGRGQYRFFDHRADRQTKQRAAMLQDLRDAIALEEFVLYYQPFIASDSGDVTGYEALIRWRHPERGMVSPADFIPLAEESGLIVPIGEWVLGRACADAMAWQDNRRVAVNISAAQFQDQSLPDRIQRALTESGLPPGLLEIELTESVLVEDIDDALSMLCRIRALGVKIALDDFGTGYSSLSYLRTLSFDRVKIDRSFVNDVITEPGSSVIIRAVGDIARGLGMTLIAEGVETREQAELLRDKGCQELQGFFYGRPVINAERLLSLDLHLGELAGTEAVGPQ